MKQLEKKLESRNLYIDEVRGIAVILMVVGHCIQYGSGNLFLEQQLYFENWAFRAIYSFHMPLFTMIAGYFLAISLQKRSSCKVFKSRMFSIGIPILSWGTINYIILILNQNIDVGLSNIIKQVFWNYLGTLWFLWALLCCTLVTIAIHKFCKGSLIAFVIIFFVSFFLPDKYNIPYASFLYPFFCFGYLWNKFFQVQLKNIWSEKIWYSGGASCFVGNYGRIFSSGKLHISEWILPAGKAVGFITAWHRCI